MQGTLRIMASRDFPDRDGARWRVWSTIPEDVRSCLPGFENGWLTFEQEASGERRRFVPIPDDWEQAAEERLLLWCRVAQPVRPVRLRGATADADAPVVLPADGAPTSSPLAKEATALTGKAEA